MGAAVRRAVPAVARVVDVFLFVFRSGETVLADARFRVVPVRAALLDLVVFFCAMSRSVHRHVVAAESIFHEAHTFHECAQVVEDDASVDLTERAFDEVLELGRIEQAGAAQGDQVPPRFGSKAAPLVGAQHAKCHGMLGLLGGETVGAACNMLSRTTAPASIPFHPNRSISGANATSRPGATVEFESNSRVNLPKRSPPMGRMQGEQPPL